MQFPARLDPREWLRLAHREIEPIGILLGIAVPVWAFSEIADEVGEGEARWFDESLLLGLRTADPADPLGPHWLEASVMDITALGGFTVLALITLFAVGYLAVQRKWADAALILFATIGGTIISESLKTGFARPRPDLVAHIVDTTSMSFPSGHAMLSAVTYLTIGALIARTQEQQHVRGYVLAAAILLTILIGVSRIYLGVHWPTDVLGGWCLGAAWALACWAAATWLTRNTSPGASSGRPG